MAEKNYNYVLGLESVDATRKEEKLLSENTDNVHSAMTQVASSATNNDMNNEDQREIIEIENHRKKAQVKDQSSAFDIIVISDDSSSEILSSDDSSDSSSEVKKVLKTVTVTTISRKSSHQKKIKTKEVTTVKTCRRIDRSIKNEKGIPMRADLDKKSAGAEKDFSLFRKKMKKSLEQDKNRRQTTLQNKKPQDVQSPIKQDCNPFTNTKDSNYFDEINVPKNFMTSANSEKMYDIEENLNIQNANLDKSSNYLPEERKKSTEQDENQWQVPLENKKAPDVRFKTENDFMPVTNDESYYLVEEMDDEEDSNPLESRKENDNQLEISEISESEIYPLNEEESIDMNISGSSEIVTPESIKIIKREKKYSEFGVANFSDIKNRSIAKSQLLADYLDTECRRKIEFERENSEDNFQEIEKTRVSADCQEIIVLSDSDAEDNSRYSRSLQNQLLRENSQNSSENSAEKKIEEIRNKDYVQFSGQEKTTPTIECNNNYEKTDCNNFAEKRNISATRARFAIQENGVCRDLIRDGYYKNISIVKPASGKCFNSQKSDDSKIKKEINTFDEKRVQDKQESPKEKDTTEKISYKRLHNDPSTPDEQISSGTKRACTEKKSDDDDRFNEGERFHDTKLVDVERWLYDNRCNGENLSFHDKPVDDENQHYEETRTHDKKSVCEEQQLRKKKSRAERRQRTEIRPQLEKRPREEKQAADKKRTDNEHRFTEENRSANKNRISNANRFPQENPIANEMQFPQENQISNENRFPQENRIANEIRIANENRFPQENLMTNENRFPQENLITNENRFPQENLMTNENRFPQKNLITNENRFPQKNRLPDKKQINNEYRFSNENRVAHENRTADGGQFARNNRSADEKRILNENRFAPENRSAIENQTADKSRFPQENRSSETNDSSNIGSFESMKPIKEEKKYSEFGVINNSVSDNVGFVKSQLFGTNIDTKRRHNMDRKDEDNEDSIEEIEESIEDIKDIIVQSDSDEDNNLSCKRFMENKIFGNNVQNFTEIDRTSADTKEIAVAYNKADAQLFHHEKTAEQLSNVKVSTEYNKNNEKTDFNKRAEEYIEKRNCSVTRPRFVVEQNGTCIDLVRTGRSWWNNFVSKPTGNSKIKKEKCFANAKRAREQQKSEDDKISFKRSFNGLSDKQKLGDEKRARIEEKSSDEGHSNEGEKAHDKKHVDEKHRHEKKFREGKRSRHEDRYNEGEILRDQKLIVLERSLFDELDVDKNRSSNDKRADEEDRRHQETRVRDDKIFRELERIHDETGSYDEKNLCEENQANGQKSIREDEQSDKERQFSEEKRSSEQNKFSVTSQSDKKIPAHEENRFIERQSAEQTNPDKERQFSEEKQPAESKFSEVKQPAKKRQSSERKPSSEEWQSAEKQRCAKKRQFSEENQHAKESQQFKEKRLPAKKRSVNDKRSAEEKRSAKDKKSAEKKRSAVGKRAGGSDYLDKISQHGVLTNDRENVENKEIRAKDDKHDDEEHKNRQQNPINLSDNNETNRFEILNDPRLKPNSYPIVLITKLGRIKKPVPIVEPPFLLKGDRRASCRNIVNLNKSVDKIEVNAAFPSTSQSSQFTAHDLPEKKKEEKKNQPKKSAPKLSKSDLAIKAKVERKIHARNQKWRRIKHPWAKVLPISTQPPPYLTSEEREKIKAIRRKQLREIAEHHKNPESEKSAPIPAANSETNDESLAKRDTAQSAKVTQQTRGYFLFSKPLEQRAKKKPGKLIGSSVENKSERKMNSESSNGDNEAIDNSNDSENEDEAQEMQNFDDMETAENVATEAKTEQSETGELKRRKRVISETRTVSEFSKIVKHVFFDDNATVIHEFEIEPGNNMKKFNAKNFACWQQRTVNNYANCQPAFDTADKKIYPKLEEFLANIFRWNPRWLEVTLLKRRNFPQEQIEIKAPPPIVDEKKLTSMLSCYRTYEEYYKIAEPLLILEMWYGISRDFEVEKPRLNFFSIVSNSINPISIDFTKVQVSTLILEVVVSRRESQLRAHPMYGDLLFFEYYSNRKDKHGFASWEVFAYVTSLRKTPITSLTNLNRDLINAVKEPHTLLTYTVMTKGLDPTDVQTNRVSRLRTISYLRSNMRMVQALQFLPESPLMNMILHPKFEDYQLPAANNMEGYPLVTKDFLNIKQLEAVVRITNAVTHKLPKVCLIQGPPGTGKSKVIVNLVTQILYGDDRYHSDKKLRILVCAPSNAAVDEIVLRLLDVRKSFEKKDRFNIVRTGRTETMNPSVKIVSLRELAKKHVNEKGNSYPSTSINDYQDERGRLEHRNLTKMYNKTEEELLKGADVIASTLTSCYTNQMEFIFGENAESISVCIVDEATQSAEPENLIPLMLGVRTLVLVGDTNQLPATVLSQKAKKFGLDQSLFARIWRVFEGEAKNPIIKLDTQYRMTIPVAHFPNKYFYAGALTNAAKMHKLPFHFYRVINLDSTQDNSKFSNVHEADFVANLVYTMIARTNYDNAILPVKVGIITPYNNQKILLRKRINERISRLKDKDRIVYEVNTVDSFQGQERDVIIMSCVRSSGIGFLSDRQRLCVALTRAKHSLILCGNFRTFHRDPMWKALLSDAQSRNVYLNVKSNSNPGDIRSHIIR